MGISVRNSTWSTIMCINSFFGIPLQKAVLWGGIFKLVLTLIFAIISVVSLSQLCEGVTDKAKCVGPQIRQVFFDILFPLACALLLIYGAKRKDPCLLLIWFGIAFISYVQYLYVFFASDWDKAEDWVAIGYVVYYTTASIVVFSFMQEAKRTDGMVHTNIIKTGQGQAAAAQATTTVTVQQQPAPAYPQQPAAVAYPQQQQFQQQQFQQQAPYDPNMAAAYAGQPAAYAAPQPAGYPGAPPAYAPQVPYAPQD